MARNNVIKFTVEVINKASKELDKISGKMGGFAKLAGTFLSRLAGVMGVVGGATVVLVAELTKTYAALNDLSKATGISVEQLSKLQYAATKARVDFGTLESGLISANTSIHDAADGTGKAADALRTLNVSARDLSKLGMEDQLFILADAFQLVGNKADRLSLAQDIWGGSASEMLKIVDKGSDGIREYGSELVSLNRVISTDTAAKSADFQDAITGLGSAFDGLKIALIDSALTPALTAFINEFSRLANIVTGADIGANIVLAAERVNTLKQKIDALQRDDKPGGEGIIAGLLATLKEAEEDYDRLLMKQGQLTGAHADAMASRKLLSVGGADPDKSGEEAAKKTLEGWLRGFDTAEMRVAEEMQKFRDAVLRGMIPEEADRIRVFDQIREIFTDNIEEIHISARYRTTKAFDGMPEAAKEAARNMHNAFAEFFFDPFEEGLSGLLKAFINVIRRLIAEMAALQVSKWFGFESTFKKIAGGTAATGGPRSGMTLVGERGPELVNLPQGSRVINNSATKAMGGVDPTFITNIDARGADPGLIARLPAIFENRDKRLMLAVQRYVTTGVMPI